MISPIFFHPHPDLPRQGGGVLSSRPMRPATSSAESEGLREGDKMALSYLLVIDQKIYCHCGFKRRILHDSARS
jgi:hypothetical protein